MTRHGSWRKVPFENALGRLSHANDHLAAARDLMDLANDSASANPAMSEALLAAIAYADALTIAIAGIQNKDDHAQIVATLKQALGERAEGLQLQRLARILADKNEIQYGHRRASQSEAKKFIDRVERFAEWARKVLLTEGIS